MRILQKDNRLPFTPVTPAQWRFILKLEAYLLEKNGFKALKLIGYRGATSFEGGWPKNPVNPKKGLPETERIRLMRNMVKLLKEQWDMA